MLQNYAMPIYLHSVRFSFIATTHGNQVSYIKGRFQVGLISSVMRTVTLQSDKWIQPNRQITILPENKQNQTVQRVRNVLCIFVYPLTEQFTIINDLVRQLNIVATF